MSDSVRPYGQQPTRLLCPWDSPGKNTGVGCHFLLHLITRIAHYDCYYVKQLPQCLEFDKCCGSFILKMYISISLKAQWVKISPGLSVSAQQVKNPWLIGREAETQKCGSFLRSGSAWQSGLWNRGTSSLIQFCTHNVAYFTYRR